MTTNLYNYSIGGIRIHYKDLKLNGRENNDFLVDFLERFRYQERVYLKCFFHEGKDYLIKKEGYKDYFYRALGLPKCINRRYVFEKIISLYLEENRKVDLFKILYMEYKYNREEMKANKELLNEYANLSYEVEEYKCASEAYKLLIKSYEKDSLKLKWKELLARTYDKQNRYIDSYYTYCEIEEENKDYTMPRNIRRSVAVLKSEIKYILNVGTQIALLPLIIFILAYFVGILGNNNSSMLLTENMNELDNKTEESIYLGENSIYNTSDKIEENNINLDKDTSNEFVLKDSNKKKLSANEINNLSEEKLYLARNEIFARHGYVFKNKDLNKYFKNKSWYTENKNYYGQVDDKIEKYNLELIKETEFVKLCINDTIRNFKNDYILLSSDRERLSKDNIKKLSDIEVLLARNEILARHGQAFNISFIKDFFQTRNYYICSSKDITLNEIEEYNYNLLNNEYKEREYKVLTRELDLNR